MSVGKLGLILGSDPRKLGALELDKYADTTIVIPATLPRSVDARGYNYGMLDNDTYGDCVSAAMYHMQETFRIREGVEPHPWTAGTALAEYFKINGVPPGPPGSASDQGTDPSVAMQYWQQHGLPGHKLAGFGVLDTASPNIRRAIFEFGAVMFAIALPVEAQDQGVVWRWEHGMQPGSWGGHAIAGDSYSPLDLGFISWGQGGSMDNAFWAHCGEQVLVPLSHDQISVAGVGPGGFDFAQMQADLASL